MANLDLSNQFGLLAQLEATLSQILVAFRSNPTHSPIKPHNLSPVALIDGNNNSGKAMSLATEDPKTSVNSKPAHPYKDVLARRDIIALAPIQTKKSSY